MAGSSRRPVERASHRPADIQPSQLDRLASGIYVKNAEKGRGCTWRAAYRLACGWKQQQAADVYNRHHDDAGTSPWTEKRVSAFETWPGTSETMTGELLVRWAKVYGTHPRNLLDDKEYLALNTKHRVYVDHPPDLAYIGSQRKREVAPRLENAPGGDTSAPASPRARPEMPPSHRDNSASYSSAVDAKAVRLIAAAADEAQSFAAFMESPSSGSTLLEMMRSELICLSADFLHRPVTQIVPSLAAIHAKLLDCLRTGYHLGSQRRELYALTGMASVVLAHASHLTGNPSAGMTQARLARLCAEEAGHLELLAWALGTQALISEHGHRLNDALAYLGEAGQLLERSRLPGTATVRLASYEARICARLHLTERASIAVRTADQAQERLDPNELADLDDVGGILSFPEAKLRFYAAETSILLGEYKSAEQHAVSAIRKFSSGPTEQYSYGDVALAYVDVARARLAGDDLDGMRTALEPVLDLPPQLRISPLRAPLAALDRTLSASRYRGVSLALEAHQALAAYHIPVSELMS